MTNERKIALRILEHFIDNMSYWEESKGYYMMDGADIEKVNAEVAKISKQIIDRYGLNRIWRS